MNSSRHHSSPTGDRRDAAPPARSTTRRSIGRRGAAALGCAALAAWVGLGATQPVAADDDAPVTLSYTGASQSVTVPAGVLGASVIVDGGAGAAGYNGLGKQTAGGAGAEVTAKFPLTTGTSLTVDVGGMPQSWDGSGPQTNPTPGWGGDAPGGTSYGSSSTVGGAGGGASSIRTSDGTYLVVAGGGGGGGGKGFAGGIDAGGEGGAGGANGTGSSGKDGLDAGHGKGGAWGGQPDMAGGAGAPEHDDAGPGGGGGGGWRGGDGGGGGSTGGGGGGGGGAGSSYLAPQAIDGIVFTASTAASGQVQIIWIRSAVCAQEVTRDVSAFTPTQLQLPCQFQGVPGTTISFGPAQHGTLSMVDPANGTIEYTPSQAGWIGTDQFSYALTNANGEVANGIVQTASQADAVTTAVSAPQASPGDQVDVTASGLQPNEHVQVNLHSDPIQLATAQADSDGTLRVTVGIPAQAEPGEHHIEVLGEHSGSHASPITLVAAAPDDGNGARWVVITLGAALCAAVVGTVGVLAVRRRRTAST